ncbi:ABC transporter substrate-binding protein [Candidatus Caldatribacterium sp. SIUC1]|uniref:ABC transporter substrate-binding protein n=1 Tax=Candidatus Caldatribacterium sp. SIUC1 TaxID=3418365 RepID=UPI003F68C1F8
MQGQKAVWFLVILLLVTLPSLVFAETTLVFQGYSNPNEQVAQFIQNVLIPEFKKVHPDIDVKYVYIPFAEYMSTILQQAVSNTLPDLVYLDNPWVPQLIDANVLQNIRDYVMKDLGNDFWMDFFPGHRMVTSKDEGIYALQVHTNNLAIFYREGFLQKVGVEKPPKTWEELLDVSRKIKENLNLYGLIFYAGADEAGTWQFEPFLWSNGGSLLELDQKEAIEALAFVAGLVKEGYAPRDVINLKDQGDETIWFMNGQVAMMVNGNWEFGWHLLPDVLEKLGDVRVAPFPVPDAAMRSAVLPFGGECVGITTTDAEKSKYAWELIRIWFGEKLEEYYEKWTGHIPTLASYSAKIASIRPEFKVFIDQAAYALPRPPMGGMEKYPDVSNELALALQKALTGAQTPEEAFGQAAKNIRNLFAPEQYEKHKEFARNVLTEVLARTKQQ